MAQGKRSADCNIDFGLACLYTKEFAMQPGECRTQEVIADVCGCHVSAIQCYEYRGLRRARAHLYRNKQLARELQEAMRALAGGPTNQWAACIRRLLT